MAYEYPWTYNGVIFDSEDIGAYYGFIYRITNLTNGYDYVGRKYFKTIKKKTTTKRQEEQTSRNN